MDTHSTLCKHRRCCFIPLLCSFCHFWVRCIKISSCCILYRFVLSRKIQCSGSEKSLLYSESNVFFLAELDFAGDSELFRVRGWISSFEKQYGWLVEHKYMNILRFVGNLYSQLFSLFLFSWYWVNQKYICACLTCIMLFLKAIDVESYWWKRPSCER